MDCTPVQSILLIKITGEFARDFFCSVIPYRLL